MMITRATKINTVISIMLFIAAVGIVVGGLSYLQRLGATLEEQVAAVASQTDREQKYAELTRLAEMTVAEREELGQYILKRQDAPDFVTAGEQMAAKQGVKYTTESLKDIVVEDGFDQLVMAFTMEGREQDVRHILKVLETLPHHAEVTRVEINRSQLIDTGEVTMGVELVVTLSDV